MNKSDTVEPTFSRAAGAVAVCLIAVSLFFRVWHLGNIPGLNGDEAVYGADALDLLHGRAVDWRTPNGNIKNVFYYVPVIVLHALLPPSIPLLRTTAVICGIAAIIVNYLLCRREFGGSCALFSSFLIAALPEDIAQSRFGWDPCESVFIDIVVFYASVRVARRDAAPGRAVGAVAIASVIAFVIHPSNLFIALFAPVAAAIRWAPETAAFFSGKQRTLRLSIVAAGAVAAAAAAWLLLHRQFEMAGRMQNAYTRGFLLDYAGLFSGRSVYKFLAGYPRPVGTIDIVDILSLVPWLFCLVYAFRVLRNWGREENADRLIAAGWMLETIAYAAVAGARNLEPGYDRYGLCLIVPAVVLLCRALDRLPAAGGRGWLAAQAALIATGAALLAGFYLCYFRFIIATGGIGQETFRTARVDPKLQAIDYVIGQCAGQDCYVVSRTWWNYQPARYFAMAHPNIHVLRIDVVTRQQVKACIAAMQSGRFWTIDFPSDRDKVREILAFPGIRWSVIEAPDYGGKPDVIIGHPLLPSRQAPS